MLKRELLLHVEAAEVAVADAQIVNAVTGACGMMPLENQLLLL
jgi:hypothetical protein